MIVVRTLAAVATLFLAVPALVGPASAQKAGWPTSITLGTASPGGLAYVYGEGLARILSRSLQIEVVAQSTQGPAQNVVLMERKEAMLGVTTMGVALQGWNGSGWAQGTTYRSMRAIFPMYDSTFQFTAPTRAGIKSLNDLAGLRIGLGPRAGTSGTHVPEIFKILGVAASFRFGPFEQMTAQAANGEVDAVVFFGGVPFPALTELDLSQPVDFIELSAEQIAVVRKQIPEISPSVIPAGTYRSLARDYRSIGIYNFVIAHKDLPDDLVHGIVKAVFDNRDELVKAHSAAKETVPANVGRNTFLPLHPGAARYYQEIGVPVPENVVPKN